VFETRPKEVAAAWNNRVRTVPINFSIDLNQLPPGHYDCQVTVLNPTEQKGMFWQVPVMVVP
jgi:hypothetical protein